MNVIFLDIDGVLFPCHGRKYLGGNVEQNKKKLCERKPNLFHDANPYDLHMVQEGWDSSAVRRLKQLIEKTNAVCVISSSWKFTRTVHELKQLFGVFDLENYIIDKTSDTYGFMKTPSIQGYIKDHPMITSYVVLDDIDLTKDFPNHCVVCPDLFTEECLEEAIQILNHI